MFRISRYMSGVKLGRSRMFLHPVTNNIFISIYLTFILLFEVFSVPINNGFTVKFNRISAKEDVKMKTFGGLFLKIPQEVTKDETQELFSDTMIPQMGDMGIGCTNQIARLLFPVRESLDLNDTKTPHNVSINLPLLDNTLENYKIIVAVAPKHIKIGKGDDARQVVVYIIFNEDDNSDSNSIKLPSIYFVTKANHGKHLQRKEKADPIFVIDSNRTVTGLKSTEVSKFIKFRNKLRNHFKYT